MANKFNQWRQEKKYAAKLNLLAKVHKAIAPQVERNRNVDEFVANSLKSYLENSPETYGMDVSKYADAPMSESLESCIAMIKKSRDDSRNDSVFDFHARKGTKSLGKFWC